MAEREADFIVAGDLAAARVLDGMRRCAGGRHGTRLRLHRTFYDTFDWRLFDAGIALEHERHRHRGRLIGRALDGGALVSVASADVPRFARDLPSSPLFRRIAGAIGVRALLPQVELRVTVDRFCLTDGENKVLVRLALERARLLGGAGDGARALHRRVRVIPVVGYGRAFEQALEALRAELGVLPRAPEPILLEALHAQAREPVDPSPPTRIPLAAELRADVALRRCLRSLLRAMEVNEAGTIADLDSEFLHDFRVAIRRARSLLSQVRGVFPEPIVEKHRRELAWLAAATGPVRDLDVHLLALDDGRAGRGAAYEADLATIRALLREEHRRARDELGRALASARYRRFVREWRRFLDSDPPRRSRLPNAMRPIAEVARKRIRRAYKRALRDGAGIDDRSPPEALHELRKTCKKLRYLLELFGSLFPAVELEACIDRLKSLQDSLGCIQDRAVQARALRGLVEQLADAGAESARTRAAVGLLVQRMGDDSARARADLEERFRAFSKEKERRRYASLFSADAQ